MENTRKAVTFWTGGEPLQFCENVKSVSSILKELIAKDLNGELDRQQLENFQQQILTEDKTGKRFKQINVRFNTDIEQTIYDYVHSKDNRALYLKSLLYYAMEHNITECTKTKRVITINVSFDKATFHIIQQQAKKQKQSQSEFVYNIVKGFLDNQ